MLIGPATHAHVYCIQLPYTVYPSWSCTPARAALTKGVLAAAAGPANGCWTTERSGLYSNI